MRADPSLLRGVNKLWIRFFLLAVFATMYVRDHMRPAFHEALGMDPTDYDYAGVPHHLGDLASRYFRSRWTSMTRASCAGLERLRLISEAIADGKKGGMLSKVKARRLAAAGRR